MKRGKNMCATYANSSKLQGDLNFAFDKTTSSPELSSNVSPAYIFAFQFNLSKY